MLILFIYDLSQKVISFLLEPEPRYSLQAHWRQIWGENFTFIRVHQFFIQFFYICLRFCGKNFGIRKLYEIMSISVGTPLCVRFDLTSNSPLNDVFLDIWASKNCLKIDCTTFLVSQCQKPVSYCIFWCWNRGSSNTIWRTHDLSYCN